MFEHPKKKIDLLRDKARISWNNFRANLHLWKPEIAKAKPYKKDYHIKYDMCRFTYCMSKIHTFYKSEKALSRNYLPNTYDHILGSSLVGECILDNSDIFLKDDKGFEKMFELYLHSLLVTYITKEENDKLAQLRGKVLTKDKYNEVGIILKKVSPKIHPKYFSKLGDAVNTVELPAPPKILTEWEITKFGIKDSGYNPLEVNPKKLIQFV
jgi:hypothetical protein